MKYHISIFQRGGECWNLHLIDYKLVSFDSIESAESEAIRLSELHPNQQVLVITIHAGFTTQTKYPKPELTTTRVTVD